MPGQARTRYPGAQPFTDDELSRKLFYGRKQESTALTYQILANRLVVLFARSGLGKTSLINAGVADRLRVERYLPLIVRVSDRDHTPVESIYREVEKGCANHKIEYIQGEKTSLWHFFKTAQFWSQDILLTPILILDQFEELFTLHSEQQRGAFLDQFSYLVRGVCPKEPEPQAAQKTGPGLTYNNTAPAIKIVISLREDFLAQLEEISDRIPDILNERFRLLPLGRAAATEALSVPAGIEDSDLVTRPFQIDPLATETILDFLERRVTKSTTHSVNSIEPFQLQLICQHMEEIAQTEERKNAKSTVTISMTEIGGESKLRKILKEFYKRQVAAVPSFIQRRRVLKLCSELLINPQGRRLRIEESEIHRLSGVNPKTLQILVDRRLLRREQSAEGSYYELSHDSLVSPIVSFVRLRFFVRMLLLLMLTLFISMITVSISSPFLIDFVQSPYEWLSVKGFVGFVLLGAFLWVIAGWGIRKFSGAKEMWRRFRIE